MSPKDKPYRSDNVTAEQLRELYYASPPRIKVVENLYLEGDQVMVDSDWKAGGETTVMVGDLYKFMFSIFGAREDIINCAIRHAISKVNERIDVRCYAMSKILDIQAQQKITYISIRRIIKKT
jgi:hypothetical protein